MATAETVLDRPAGPEVAREEILERFRREHPDLAEAMQLAGEAEAIWEAFERARQPTVIYSANSGTEIAR